MIGLFSTNVSFSFFKFICFFLLIGAQKARGRIDFTDCGSKVIVTDVRITDCSEAPCEFIKGKKYRLEFDAISTTDSKYLPYSVKARTKYFFFPLTLVSGNACDEFSTGSCPLAKNGTSFTFYKDFDIIIPFYIPSQVPATIIAEMSDENGQKLLCANLNILIKSNQLYYYNVTTGGENNEDDISPNLSLLQNGDKKKPDKGFLSYFSFF